MSVKKKEKDEREPQLLVHLCTIFFFFFFVILGNVLQHKIFLYSMVCPAQGKAPLDINFLNHCEDEQAVFMS